MRSPAHAMHVHNRRKARQGQKYQAQLDQLIHEGMSEEEVITACQPLVQDMGKKARKAVYAAARRIAQLPQPKSRGERLRTPDGTWVERLSCNQGAAYSRAECIAAGLTPGPGND